jgi:hypothetical protein
MLDPFFYGNWKLGNSDCGGEREGNGELGKLLNRLNHSLN